MEKAITGVNRIRWQKRAFVLHDHVTFVLHLQDAAPHLPYGHAVSNEGNSRRPARTIEGEF